MTAAMMVLTLLGCGLFGGKADRAERPERADAEDRKEARKGESKASDGHDHGKGSDATGDLADKEGLRDKERKHRKKLKLTLPEVEASLAAGQDVLFVTWDTIRADHLSLYGYPRRTTPGLEKLAKNAVVFDRFIVPMATTLPSHTSMFTGVRPEEHGIIANATEMGERFVPSEVLVPFAAHLSSKGYVTAAAVSSSPLKKHSGIHVGFDNWSQPVSHHRRGDDTVGAALAFLEQMPDDRPVFLWVHFYDPHSPYASPPGMEVPATKGKAYREHVEARRYGNNSERRLDRYDTDILFTDQQTERLVKQWKDKRDWDRTVFVLAGDHGEGLGQHHHLEHGLTWDEQIHTAFMIRANGLESRRVGYPVGAHDILPTVLGLVDVPEEEAWLAQVTGRDVLADGFEPTPIFSRMSLRQVHKDKKPTFALTGERWKFVGHGGGRTSLYDLSADPHERKEISDKHPEVVKEFTAAVKASLKAQKALGERLGTGKLEALDEEAVGELRALGYLE